MLPHLPLGVADNICADAAHVLSSDIWSGGTQRSFLPRGREDRVDCLLGKRGQVFDRHPLAADDLLGKFVSARWRLASKRCS